MADYWAHWLAVGNSTDPANLPKIFQVNWFRKGSDGTFLWPGFGENSRVLEWVIRRVQGKAEAIESPVGHHPDVLNVDGLGMSESELDELFHIDPLAWLAECDLTDSYFQIFGARLPVEMQVELDTLRHRLKSAAVPA